jgi:hypothetical protein
MLPGIGTLLNKTVHVFGGECSIDFLFDMLMENNVSTTCRYDKYLALASRPFVWLNDWLDRFITKRLLLRTRNKTEFTSLASRDVRSRICWTCRYRIANSEPPFSVNNRRLARARRVMQSMLIVRQISLVSLVRSLSIRIAINSRQEISAVNESLPRRKSLFLCLDWCWHNFVNANLVMRY